MMIVAITHTTSRHTTSTTTGATIAGTSSALLMVLVVIVLVAILCDILVAGDKKVMNFKMSSIEKHVKYEPPELHLLIS